MSDKLFPKRETWYPKHKGAEHVKCPRCWRVTHKLNTRPLYRKGNIKFVKEPGLNLKAVAPELIYVGKRICIDCGEIFTPGEQNPVASEGKIGKDKKGI